MKIIRAADEQAAQQKVMLEGLISKIQQAQQGSTDPATIVATVLKNTAGVELAKFVTQDPDMLELKDRAQLLSAHDDPVLITGPSGTGKEIIAKALHGSRIPAKFLALNCAGMPEQLIESELFGHVAGAFTGAQREHLGLFRQAHGGTLFLDELGEAPMALQAKLLRVLQAHNGRYKIRPVGGVDTYEVNVRIVAATCRDLDALMSSGQFREDLYGRLMSFELRTKGLSARPLDVPLILRHLGLTDLNDHTEIYSDYWQNSIKRFNVRALQAYVRRQKVYAAYERRTDGTTDSAS